MGCAAVAAGIYAIFHNSGNDVSILKCSYRYKIILEFHISFPIEKKRASEGQLTNDEKLEKDKDSKATKSK